MSVWKRLGRPEPRLVSDDFAATEPIIDRPLHWFALYTYWKTLPITIGLVTLFSLLPGVIALLIVIGFGLFYEFGEDFPDFLKDTVLQDVIDYELEGMGPILDQLRHNRSWVWSPCSGSYFAHWNGAGPHMASTTNMSGSRVASIGRGNAASPSPGSSPSSCRPPGSTAFSTCAR
jgi:hypothetical protein